MKLKQIEIKSRDELLQRYIHNINDDIRIFNNFDDLLVKLQLNLSLDAVEYEALCIAKANMLSKLEHQIDRAKEIGIFPSSVELYIEEDNDVKD